jgi:multidrug efflux pump subunit AcrB
VLALALVFGVLLAEFRNFSAPVAILTSSVLSLSGVSSLCSSRAPISM